MLVVIGDSFILSSTVFFSIIIHQQISSIMLMAYGCMAEGLKAEV
jgi:hypothetical protein